MTVISSYYAKVGVGVDQSALKTVDAYLKSIEKQLKGFQTRISKTQSLQLNFKVNQASLNRSLKQSLLVAGQTTTLRIGKVAFDKNAVNKAVTQAMGGNVGVTGRPQARIGARLSQDSLNAMRQQIRASLSNITIRPNINPRMGAVVSPRTSVGGGGTRGGVSPFQHSFGPRGINPFVFGGMAGGMMRFGAFALPGVAGVLGLNALANTGALLENQQIMMQAALNDPQAAKQQMQFLSELGDRLGRKTTLTAPFYAQMSAGVRGTTMEPTLESGFTSFMEYASVMGLNDEQMKGSIRA